MIFNSYYIKYSDKLSINSILSYKNIMNKFIVNYILKKNIKDIDVDVDVDVDNKNIYKDAITYSKYYLYWKIYDCIYDDKIMEVLFEIDT